jgi:hypothetical protein
MFSNPKKVLISLVALALFSFSPKTYADDEIRINLPAGAQLKVRNDFGNVSAEVWDNNYVAVSAVIGGEGSKGFTRSPVVIDNRGSVLSISVIRRPIDPAVTIDLNLKIPATSVTPPTAVDIHWRPSWVSHQTGFQIQIFTDGRSSSTPCAISPRSMLVY